MGCRDRSSRKKGLKTRNMDSKAGIWRSQRNASRATAKPSASTEDRPFVLLFRSWRNYLWIGWLRVNAYNFHQVPSLGPRSIQKTDNKSQDILNVTSKPKTTTKRKRLDSLKCRASNHYIKRTRTTTLLKTKVTISQIWRQLNQRDKKMKRMSTLRSSSPNV